LGQPAAIHIKSISRKSARRVHQRQRLLPDLLHELPCEGVGISPREHQIQQFLIGGVVFGFRHHLRPGVQSPITSI
jgi:hypothetical protein